MKKTLAICFLFLTLPLFPEAKKTPNIIYLMLDEWGYFESSHMKNPELKKPNIDQFAAEGMRFTQALAGAPVCGPTRCVLLTGLHSGHTSMRANSGFTPIREEEPTIASMLKQKGYRTGGFGKWGIDEDDPSWKVFKDKNWKAGQYTDRDAKVYAAFMHMVDRQLGEIIRLLKKLNLDKNTIIFVCGDNGGQDYFSSDDRPHGFFAANLNPTTGERFRGGKRSLYEGGLRVPMLVRWPGKIRAESVSDHLLYFPDVMPTLAEIAGVRSPETDGLSFLPTLLGKSGQKQHDYLYWEYKGQTAVRRENWKAYKSEDGKWELYDLSRDIEEKNDLAKKESHILTKLIAFTEKAHEPPRIGKIYNRELTEKDRVGPHSTNLE